ncbi:MAG: type II toxin-antitoxin system PemK/MazF family toxin [Limisphaerales bacterium]
MPGEIWRVDFGMAAKIRPALVVSDYPRDEELALLIVIPHTTAVRGNRWELALPKPFLKPRRIPTCNKSSPFRWRISMRGWVS